MDKKELIRILDNEIKRIGFQKKTTSWYLDEGNIIKVLSLQKSSYSNLFYVNISIFLKSLGKEEFPKEEQCHIRTRLDNSIVGIQKNYDYLFDLENVKLDKEEYTKEIKDCVQENIIPQFEAIKSKEGILKIAKTNPAILNMLPLKVKEYFGI